MTINRTKVWASHCHFISCLQTIAHQHLVRCNPVLTVGPSGSAQLSPEIDGEHTALWQKLLQQLCMLGELLSAMLPAAIRLAAMFLASTFCVMLAFTSSLSLLLQGTIVCSHHSGNRATIPDANADLQLMTTLDSW